MRWLDKLVPSLAECLLLLFLGSGLDLVLRSVRTLAFFELAIRALLHSLFESTQGLKPSKKGRSEVSMLDAIMNGLMHEPYSHGV